jgi:hypothetical protein
MMKCFEASATQIDLIVAAIDFSYIYLSSYPYATNDVENNLVYISMLAIDPLAEEAFLYMFLMFFLM